MKAATHEGGAIARTARGDALILADEDHRAVRVLDLPLGQGRAPFEVAMPGAPAQVLALPDRVLVTVREPGSLLVMKEAARTAGEAPAGPEGRRLVEVARVPVAADAWGVAVTPDEKTAIVTSAWTHTVTAVDLDAGKVRWTASVAREPRGVVVTPDGATAYVSHLVGSALTRIAVGGGAVSRVELPAAPLRTPPGKPLDASFGFAVAVSEDRVFAARHALGALGTQAWFGASTVDVMLLAGEAPLAPKHSGRAPFVRADKETRPDELTLPGGALGAFTQPRAMVRRGKTQSLLVAAEGIDAIVELDAVSIDPTNAVMRTYTVGSGIDPYLGVATTCGAPQGIALSADEATAYVLCRATYDVAEVKLDPHDGTAFAPAVSVVVRFADDPLGGDAATGRRLFYSATDRVTSGGLACSGCHPEGRDDGHVWHEARFNTSDGTHVNFVGMVENLPEEERVKGVPRRTPMLAGRIAEGPYGWHAESPDLPSRLVNGFGLHRWGGLPPHQQANLEARAAFLAAFLRRGLVTPPQEARALTPEEEKGKAIFLSDAARCAKCHVPESDYTDRMAYPMAKLPVRPGFDDEPQAEFKTPSLKYVAGHAPYFHDGSAASLEDLIARNGNRMGQTEHLSLEERAALVAFLRTL
ncbi:Hypothetical protein CAP_3519 [Chondromyces apiculatus DSM 436]|uniref:Cytochrome c domain-containing protein n=1 Tax=Chondromyces apiculatus DSM 436 TaxID=1192034 RepID=A0A017T7F0_9BACT|nr:Hypothetical protein CAP_3519 [Chondromyces apiculatus DSM 436]